MALFILILIVVLIAAYALVGRPWLRKQSWAQGFLSSIEPLELALFKKSETILMGRLLWVGSLLVSLYDGIAVFATSLDLTPITTRIMDFLHIPQDLRGLTASGFVMAIGLMINRLRKMTTKPIELVAVSNNNVTTDQAAAMALADATKDEAVAAVKAP